MDLRDQSPRRYRSLDAREVIKTISALRARISERFPGSGLVRVCGELLNLADESSARAHAISRPNIPLRAAVFTVLAIGAAGLAWIAALVGPPPTEGGVFSLVEGFDAGANLIVLSGAAVFFLVRIEERLKRRQALATLHEIRSVMHVIDMHQLTKDPSAMSISETASSPARALTPADTARYLDYCSEMLSLGAKVAVLFAEGFPDPAVIETVSEVERLATGLSQKIWQKIMILQSEELDRPKVDARRAGGPPVHPIAPLV